VLPVPPVADVYHNKLVPVAVNGTAVTFVQYDTGDVTVGNAGVPVTVTINGVRGPSQVPNIPLT
jgi:hypothetical protein